MRMQKFDRYINNEMEEDIRKELKKMELQQQVADNTQNIADNTQNIDDHTKEIHNINTRHIPLNIQSKLIVVFLV
jgi:L-lactate utilization protein LutB